jgi:peptidoglycan hydrolase CwlO-like protein
MKKMLLIAVLLGVPAFAQTAPAASGSASANKPLPQETQIKMLKAERDLQKLQLQINDLQQKYQETVKQAQALQREMGDECAAAAKEASVDLTKFTCDVDSLTFAPRPEPKKADTAKADAAK